MSDGLLSIGAFAHASLLSVKSLRAYHAAGILVPARVDGRTGYRAYTTAQLIDAAVLRRLRRLDLPLEDVAVILRARDPAVTRAVLARHERTMRDRLAEVAGIVSELQAHTDAPSALTPVFVRREPATHALAVTGRATEANFPRFLAEAYAELDAVMASLGAAPSGPGGALYPSDPDADDTEVLACVPVDEPVVVPAGSGRVRLVELPEVTVAVLTHVGDYDTIEVAYRALGAWVADHAEPLEEPVREWYVVSWDRTDDPATFRTEIAWPCRPDASLPVVPIPFPTEEPS